MSNGGVLSCMHKDKNCSPIYWIGARKSDIVFTNGLFEGSVTLYGDGKDGNVAQCREASKRLNHNNIANLPVYIEFNTRQMSKLIKRNENAQFMWYNPYHSFLSPDYIQERVICRNSEHLYQCLDSKFKFHAFAKGTSNLIETMIVDGKDCSFETLSEHIGGECFVVQSDIASGGDGSRLIYVNSPDYVLNSINPEEQYLVSRYIKGNIPVNIHALIYENDIILSPGSVQMISKKGDYLHYLGGDFAKYNKISKENQKKVFDESMAICEKIRETGYNGVLGLDLILAEKQAYVVEVNPRFQASTSMLNRALLGMELPSMHHLNLEAFNDYSSSICQKDMDALIVPFSTRTIQSIEEINYNIEELKNSPNVAYVSEEDGFEAEQPKEDSSYAFNVMFNNRGR